MIQQVKQPIIDANIITRFKEDSMLSEARVIDAKAKIPQRSKSSWLIVAAVVIGAGLLLSN